MVSNRRSFLYQAAAAVGAARTKAGEPATPRSPEVLLDLSALPRFVDRLPIPRKTSPAGFTASRDNPAHKIPHYRIAMHQFQAKVHRDMPPTTFWGYGSTFPGPTFEVRS